tara:strand:- start:151 stop:411 length:261 start_codon:yes stop_codon:yes gene_type:complete
MFKNKSIYMTENYSAFEGLNLNNARSKNETREEYKLRKKRNRKILKIYNKVGREQFQQMFPEGVNYKMFEQPTKEEVNEKQNKTAS